MLTNAILIALRTVSNVPGKYPARSPTGYPKPGFRRHPALISMRVSYRLARNIDHAGAADDALYSAAWSGERTRLHPCLYL